MSRKNRSRKPFSLSIAVTTGSLLALGQVLPATNAQTVTSSATSPLLGNQADADTGDSTIAFTTTDPTSSSSSLDSATNVIPPATSVSVGLPNSVVPPEDETNQCGGLECQHGSVCMPGNATFNIDTDVGFHTVTNRNGYYCSCPDGFSGLDCSRPYLECDAFTSTIGMNARCYHGGVCLLEGQIEDTEYAAFCECSGAKYNGQRYAGKYCEVAVEDNEYCPDHEGLFCLNGGTCPTGGARAPRLCTCRDGYFGEHCEYVTSKGPDCTLECFNEGVCRVGRANAPWGNQDDFYCECPKGYGGIQCEHLSETCGDGNTVCLHGATCESAIDADGSTSFFCSCPETYLGGSGCKQKSRMELCNPTLGPEYSQSMAVPAFCLNGGTCRDVLNGKNVYVQMKLIRLCFAENSFFD